MILKTALFSVLFLTPLVAVLCAFAGGIFTIGRTLSKTVSKKTESPALSPAAAKARDRINTFLGTLEYYVRPVRNTAVSVFMAVIAFGMFFQQSPVPAGLLEIAALWILVGFSQRRWLQAGLKAVEFARVGPDLHPQVFFSRLHQLLGPLPFTLPDPRMEAAVNPTHASFVTDHRPRQNWAVLIPALWDTAVLAHLSLKSLKNVGIDYARHIFDVMSSMWGKRVLELTKSSLTVTGADKLADLRGKNIIVCNHKSQMDFILTFFGLSHCRVAGGRTLKPRFITAKDHFVDNPLVYDMLGVGRLIEAVDMVFIERKNKSRSIQNLEQAADFLANKDIDIAIFPQGTRAEGNRDRSGKRRDAGYYTTVPPKDMESDMGHLRKGCAYLAVDTLLKLKETGSENQVNLIFVGIKGTATMMAKQSLRMQSETDIEFVIAPPLTLTTDHVRELHRPKEGEDATRYLKLVDQVHREINHRMVDSLDLHAGLRQRFLLDLQGHIRYQADRIEGVERAFLGLGDDADIVYQTLDRIYACPQSDWNEYLSQIAHLLLDGAQPQRLRSNRTQVTEHMLRSLTTKLHGKKIAPPSKPSTPAQTASAA